MTLYALDDVGDAVEATRAFLLPFDRSRWLRLALVALFVGGGGTGVSQVSNGTAQAGTSGSTGPPLAVSALPDGVVPVLVGVVVLLLVAALVFAFVGAVLEFVFLESLRRESVALRAYWRVHWRRGARLFGFRVALALVTLVAVGLVVGLVAAPFVLGVPAGAFLLLLIAVPLLVGVVVVGALAGGFTTEFVAPVVVLEERGVLDAWRRFWPTLTGAWRQYAVYAVVSFVLRLAGGILASLVTLVAVLVLAVPLGLVAAAGFALTGPVAPVGWALVGLALVALSAGVVVTSLLAAVPVQTFLRYYALFVLGDTNEAFDLVPERRRAVRTRA